LISFWPSLQVVLWACPEWAGANYTAL